LRPQWVKIEGLCPYEEICAAMESRAEEIPGVSGFIC